MTYQVLTGAGGLAGWNLLNRSAAQQINIIANEGAVKNAAAYFRENISDVTSADDLVSDYRMLSVALKAFGLEGDINNKFFIRKVLAEGASDREALANRLSDKRYLGLARAFGLDKNNPNINQPGFADRIVTAYVEREFEARVGEGDQNLRLALNARRELPTLAARGSNDNTKWFEVIGQPPLRNLFEGAFGFSESYGKLPIDRQLQEYQNAAEKMFGSSDFSNFADPENVEKLIQNFLVRSQVTQMQSQSRFSTALQLLSS